jgi:hypothetical protein
MDSPTHDYVRERCYKAHLLGFRFVATSAVDFKDGMYVPREGQAVHPLDYILLIDDGPFSGDWRADIQRVLGVSTAWTEGCIQGFAGEVAHDDGDDYRAGHLCGRAVFEDMRDGWRRKYRP